jgi:hypothetical protein
MHTMKRTNPMLRRHAQRRAGFAQMVEMVFTCMIILLFLILLFIFAWISVRVQHTSAMARYEVWRQVDDAPGPSQTSWDSNNIQLNSAFYTNTSHHVRAFAVPAGQDDDPNQGADPNPGAVDPDDPDALPDDPDVIDPDTLVDVPDEGTTNYFPLDPYNEFISAANGMSSDAGALADALIYRADGAHRYSRGRQKVFGAQFRWTAWFFRSAQVTMGAGKNNEAGEKHNPGEDFMKRHFLRIGTDWPYQNKWQASHGHYKSGGGGDSRHLRALRDTFYLEFDQSFDAIDGGENAEYNGAPSEHPGGNLAGLIRKLYLRAPGYRGPTVE